MDSEIINTESETSLDTVTQSQPIIPDSSTSTGSRTPTMSTSNSSTDIKDYSMNSYSGITKLTSSTFNDWKLRLTTVLGAQRLSKYILRDIIPPTDDKLLDDHETFSMKALAAIHATIDAENFEVIRSTTCPRKAYQMLCKHHDDTGGLSTANLFSELVTMRLGSDGCLKDHLHQFRKVHNDLISNISSSPNLSISEPFVAIILINSLPSEFTPLVQSLLTNFDSLNLTRLYSLLQMEATRTSTSSDSALSAVKHKPQVKKKDSSMPSNGLVCSLGHPGHNDENCRVRRWRAFKEYEKTEKAKSSSRSKEVAKITSDSLGNSNNEESHPSYWESAFSATISHALPSSPLLGDTGASSHMFKDKHIIEDIESIKPTMIGVASKEGAIWASERGSVSLGSMRLSSVFYSPKLTGNLVSIGRLCDQGYHAVFHKTWGVILNSSDKVVLRLRRNMGTQRLWFIEQPLPSFNALSAHTSNSDLAKLWHSRLGHSHPDAVIKFLNVHRNISLTRRDFSECDSCAMGKLSQSPSTIPFHRSTGVLHLIHSDLIGPISPPTSSGARYILTFIDDHTRHNVIYLLKNKSQTFDKFKEYKSMIEKRMSTNIVKLKTDRGREYSSTIFLEYLQTCGIQIERGPADRPQANSVSERFNLTLLSKIRSQLIESGLPLHLWGEAAVYSSLQINCTPSKAVDFNIPIRLLEDSTPTHCHPFDIIRLKPFGSLCFALDKKRTSKVAPVAKRYIFVGLESNARAVRLWDKATSRILITGDVTHRELIFPARDPSNSPSVVQDFQFPDLSDQAPPPATPQTSPPVVDTPQTIQSLTEVQDSTPDDFHECVEGLPTPIPDDEVTPIAPSKPQPPVLVPPTAPVDPIRKSGRVTQVPDRYGFSATLGRDPDHPTFQQAMASPDRKAWESAMKDEFDSLTEHNVGTLVDPPSGANIIGGMWIFNKKRDEFNRVVRFKARWVVFGNHQIKGIDYLDTYASVGKIDSLRILLAIAASRQMKVHQFDVFTAFLNGDMEDCVYTIQVRGFAHPTQPHRVWKLNRSLYGTKQAARRWQQHFGRTAAEFKIHPTSSDGAVYVLKNDVGLLLIHLHVDDALIFSDSEDLFSQFKTFIDSKYKLKWTMQPTLYLGIKISFNSQGRLLQISQPQYIESTLDQFALTNCKTATTPFPQKIRLTPGTAEEIEAAKDIPYQELVGCLQWITCCTRPDIAYAVSQLSRFNSSFTVQHWTAAKHVLRYLKGTATLGISYGVEDFKPIIYSDSDFSQCAETRRSISGYVVMMSGGAVCWKSQRQSVVALSTTEAEYISSAEASKHISWVRSFMFDIFHQLEGPTTFNIDNTSAIFTATGEGIKSRSKHIDRRHHHIRDMFQSNQISIYHVSTDKMLADYLTKPLGATDFSTAIQLNNMKASDS